MTRHARTRTGWLPVLLLGVPAALAGCASHARDNLVSRPDPFAYEGDYENGCATTSQEGSVTKSRASLAWESSGTLGSPTLTIEDASGGQV